MERVRSKWAEIVGKKFPLFEKAGHCFLIGDGAKRAKEGRRMPGVKKLAQESETQSKPEHCAGATGDARAAQYLPKDSLCLLDRYFPTVPALRELARQNAANARKVDIIARMKLSVVAYREAPEARPGQRGRKARKGEKIRLADLFETERASFWM